MQAHIPFLYCIFFCVSITLTDVSFIFYVFDTLKSGEISINELWMTAHKFCHFFIIIDSEVPWFLFRPTLSHSYFLWAFKMINLWAICTILEWWTTPSSSLILLETEFQLINPDRILRKVHDMITPVLSVPTSCSLVMCYRRLWLI